MADAPGVIHMKNIPYGFQERQITSYFQQFGTVLGVKMERSRKTGHSLRRAYIAFADNEIARVAADTMHNYLMFDRRLHCTVVPSRKVAAYLSKISKKAPKKTTIEKNRARHNSVKTDNQWKKIVSRKLKNIRTVEKKLKDIGVDFQCMIVNNPRNLNKDATRDTILVDSSDDDIKFKTPPTAKKVRKVKTTGKTVVESSQLKRSKRLARASIDSLG